MQARGNFGLLALAAAAAALSWQVVRPAATDGSLRGSAVLSRDLDRGPPGPDSGGRDALLPPQREIDAAPEKARPEVRRSSLLLPMPPELVRVHGRVQRYGRPVAGCEVAFRTLEERFGEEADWDLTDEDGRYEVRLLAASYVLAGDDDEPWTTNAVIPEGPEEFVLDIELP